jgi:alkanesulfonate monooxygenase SsuD/methylene tetrahydromethanopterin reductase-like flavin-dependent oxidoreductase (luciferase family)
MKAKLLAGGLFIVVLVSACTDREAEARRAKEEADAKARAEAARKEMDALPKAFKSRDYFKQNEPEKKPEPTPTPVQPKPNP